MAKCAFLFATSGFLSCSDNFAVRLSIVLHSFFNQSVKVASGIRLYKASYNEPRDISKFFNDLNKRDKGSECVEIKNKVINIRY